MANFASWLGRRRLRASDQRIGLIYGSVKNYCSGANWYIRYWTGFRLIADNFQYSQVMKGIKKQDAAEGRWKHPVLPIMLRLLILRERQKRGGWTLFRVARATCALVLLMFLLRVSEGTCPSLDHFLQYPGDFLSRANVVFDGVRRLPPEGARARTMAITIDHRKNSQFGKAMTLRHSALPDDLSESNGLERLDVVGAVQEYFGLLRSLGERPFDANRPLFTYLRNRKWAPITAKHIRDWLKKGMGALGLDPRKYSSHSLRKGGATAMYINGVAVELIRLYGGWADAQFLETYVFPDVKATGGIAAKMVSNATEDRLKLTTDLVALTSRADNAIAANQDLELNHL